MINYVSVKTINILFAFSLISGVAIANPDGEEMYNNGHTPTCASCHDRGIAGAPILGKNEDWEEYDTSSVEVMFEKSMEAPAAMPEPQPKSDNHADTRAAIEYMKNELE